MEITFTMKLDKDTFRALGNLSVLEERTKAGVIRRLIKREFERFQNLSGEEKLPSVGDEVGHVQD